MPTGDYVRDTARVERYYHSITPRHPRLAMQSIVDASDYRESKAA
jgi:hypothetical protein